MERNIFQTAPHGVVIFKDFLMEHISWLCENAPDEAIPTLESIIDVMKRAQVKEISTRDFEKGTGKGEG